MTTLTKGIRTKFFAPNFNTQAFEGNTDLKGEKLKMTPSAGFSCIGNLDHRIKTVNPAI